MSIDASITTSAAGPALDPYTGELHPEAIRNAVDRVCDAYNRQRKTAKKTTQFVLTRATISELVLSSDGTQNLLYGIVAMDETQSQRILTTFYFAYSTWDGRYLYLDQRYRGNNELKLWIRQALAGIAFCLKCSRLTWQHFERDSGEFSYESTMKPETLHGWLTLHWPLEKMHSFLDRQGVPEIITTSATKFSDEFQLADTVKQVLQNCQHDKFQLRLATEDDIPYICRLIQGLADYEKESDAVNISSEHYRIDGFRSKPLFYCLLLDCTENENDQSSNTCGMAFHYLGCTKQDGLFLYLEDLFIEEKYRKGGAGTLMMEALATIGTSLGCSRLVWQALDWNTPALTFYSKLGAEVQEGLLTTRFANEDLKQFALAPLK